jgi:hypothetical protein
MVPRYCSWIILLSTFLAPNPCLSLAPLNPRSQVNGNSPSLPNGGKKSKVSSSLTTPEDDNKSASISAATFNVIKACVGSGVLALPAGLALLTDQPQGCVLYLCIE